MGDIQAILLVPGKGDPLGLLADGVCGSRPPMAVRRTYPRVVHEGNGFADPTVPCEMCKACDQPWPCDTPGKVESEGHVRWKPASRYTTVFDALVLAWDGKPVSEGIDRLGRPPGRCGVGWVREVVGVHLGTRLDDSDALTDPDLPGTLVLIDADGKEIE